MNTGQKVCIRIWNHEVDADQMTAEELYESLMNSFDAIKLPSYSKL